MTGTLVIRYIQYSRYGVGFKLSKNVQVDLFKILYYNFWNESTITYQSRSSLELKTVPLTKTKLGILK